MVVTAGLVAGLVGFGLADASGSSSGYTVRAGDTLWGIATAHGITVAQLASANNLDPNQILPIGKNLVFPGSGSAATATAAPRPRSGNPWTFCSSFVATPGRWGVLPSGLAGSTAYRQLKPLFDEWAGTYNVSEPLLEAIAWQESGWQEGVVSPTGAVGVGQIEPGTAAFISSQLVGEPLNLRSSSDNIRMSAAFVSYLANLEGDNRCATIAAYYEGPINLQKYGVVSSARTYVADVEALEPMFQ